MRKYLAILMLASSSVLFLLSTNKAFGEWDPVDLISESLIDGNNLPTLSDQKFQNLKSKVSEYLSNTWCSKEKSELIMDLIVLERPNICVEIGVFTGSSFLPIATTLQYLENGTAYAIDSWSNSEAIKDLNKEDPNWNWWANLDMNYVQNTFKKMVSTWGIDKYTHILKETSECAFNKLGVIDFLHLDGNNFSSEVALKDAELYVTKVKEGGYILCSNTFIVANGAQPKLQSFLYLLDSCDIVCEIDAGNTILLKKN